MYPSLSLPPPPSCPFFSEPLHPKIISLINFNFDFNLPATKWELSNSDPNHCNIKTTPANNQNIGKSEKVETKFKAPNHTPLATSLSSALTFCMIDTSIDIDIDDVKVLGRCLSVIRLDSTQGQ